MKTAIDRLSIGVEKEVDILEFDGYKTSTRFVCPECGEYVFAAIGKRNGFRHYKGSGLDCDRRVDNSDSFTFYERVGLPIYLVKENNSFTLNIGFYSLGKDLLQLAQKENLNVIITTNSANNYQKHIIDFTFFENDVTLKKFDFMPYFGTDYKITLSNTNCTSYSYISQKWSDYADGFLSSGAVFSCFDNKGKKYRKNDTLTTNTEYYLILSDSADKPYGKITLTFEGGLKIGHNHFSVYKIIIPSCKEDEFKTMFVRYLSHLFNGKTLSRQGWNSIISQQ